MGSLQCRVCLPSHPETLRFVIEELHQTRVQHEITIGSLGRHDFRNRTPNHLSVNQLPSQGCGKWNPRICDTTKRASQRLTPMGEIPKSITEVEINPE